MEFIELVGIGLLAGIISSFFGIGGGLVIVPCLLLVYPDMPYPLVIGCSFGIIFLNSIINTYNFNKLKLLLPFSFLKMFLLGVIPGVLAGTYLVTSLPTGITKKVFATFLILVVVKNHLHKNTVGSEDKMNLEGRASIKLMTGFFAGLIAGLTGIGGGTVLVPIFLQLFPH